MASPQAADKFKSTNAHAMYWKDGNFSTAADIDEWVDMFDFEGVFMSACSGNLTGAGVSALSIIADAESDGSGGNIVIATSADDVATAEGDYMTVECTAEQIRQEGVDNSKNLRYVSAKLTLANAADEAVVAYCRYGPRFAKADLTAGVAT